MLKESALLGDLGVDGMIIIIMLKWCCGVSSSVTEQGAVAGSYEHVGELSRSMESVGILTEMSD
jgi:hypothetical protein